MSRSFVAPPPLPYRRSFCDRLMRGEPLHFACSRGVQNEAKHRVIKKRRAQGKLECRFASGAE